MSRNRRKLFLTLHITFSVGWIGAVAVFIALGIAGLNSSDEFIIRSAFFSMGVTGWYVILPFCLASFFTGIIQSLTTPWGLFKHNWILVKFIITIISALLLLLHMQEISNVAGLARITPLPVIELQRSVSDLLIKAIAAFFALIAAIAISVYKPWGSTKFGQKMSQQNKDKTLIAPKRKLAKGSYVMIGIIFLIVMLVILHLAGNGLKHY